LLDIIHSTLKYTVTDTSISLNVHAKEGDQECEYAFELDFHAKVVPKALKKCLTSQSVTFVIFKKDITARHWPHLSKTVLPYVKTDFTRWTWEGDESDDMEEDSSTDIIDMDTDSSSAGTKSGELLKQPNRCSTPPSVTTPATPQVLWAQRSSPTEKMKNIVSFCVNAQDIAESTLKCTVTDTSISFRAYAREDYEEREYAFDLDFYADVIPEAVESHLTAACLTIILLKKQMNARYWPRLSKVGGVLPYVRTDFTRWTWEGDHNDDIIDESTPEMISGQHFGQMDELDKHGLFFLRRFERLGEIEDIEKAISFLGDGVQRTPDEHRDKPSRLNNLGISRRRRFERLGEMGDIEKAISSHEDAVQLTPDSHADRPTRLSNLGISFARRFEHLGEMGDIKKAISSLEDAVQLTPDGHADKPGQLNNLGTSLSTRFKRLGEMGDIEKAISSLEDAVQLTPDGHADKPGQLNNLGTSFLTRFERLGEMGDIEKAISSLEDAVQLTPDGHADKPSRLNNLGNSLSTRFKCLGEMGDIEKAISSLEDAVRLTPDGHADKPSLLSNLGNSLSTRFERLGEMGDIEKAITSLEDAVQLTPDGHADKPGRLNNLGTSLLTHFKRRGEMGDIEKAISSLEDAVQLIPDGHADKPCLLNNLGTSLKMRFKHLGEMGDIGKAISSLEDAVRLTSDGHADKPGRLNNLGNLLSMRFERLGEMEDIEKTISSLEDAVQLTPDGRADKPGRLNNLGNSLKTRFKRLGEMGDIERAISSLEDAVQLTPDGHADKPDQLNNLGTSLLTRFERLGEMEDIEKAISSLEDAVQLTPDGHADKPGQLNNLGISLLTRFELLGEMGDIEKAISSLEDAVQLTPDGHADNASRLNNLGISLLTRFERLGEMEDIKKGISFLEDAVQLTPDGHADKPSRLNNLGNSLSTRFERLGEIGDIEKAISSLEEAVQLTPDGHVDKPRQLCNLGNSLSTRFERLGETEDIEKAISSLEDAVQLTPDGHADNASRLNNLGRSLLIRFELCRDPKDLKRSIFAAYKSATQSTGPPSVRFRSAISWSQRSHLCRDDSMPSILEAYATAFELLLRMSWLGLSISSRHRELINARTLACDAAATAISEKHLYMALEWLEQGRSVLWGQILHLRTPLDGLHATDPELAAKLASVARALESGSSQAFFAGGDNEVSPEQAAQKHRRLADEWETVVEHVRKLPHFERFLLPKQYSELRDAARNGPVVVLNASQYGCDALIIASPLQLRHVRLDKLTYEHAHSLRQLLYSALDSQQLRDERRMRRSLAGHLDRDATFRDVLGQLWEMVVKPVLGCFEPHQLEGNLHIRWCPTGPLAFLPIHAAGIYNADGTVSHSLADVVISSYTPSLSALLNSSGRQVSEKSSWELLVVSQENSPGVHPLPGTTKELQYIHDRASDLKLSYHSLQGQEATVSQVLSAMKKYPWVHFACHGIQDTADPMNSGLRLSDGLLQLSDIIKEPLPNAEFAFLSACQTATGDESRPEEAIHLGAGMLLAGYRSVIGTMWSIQDNIAPLVADEVYAQILGDGKPNSAKAAQALQTAVRGLRERGYSFPFWVPFIHMGV
ncbi:hypothetical protein PILCRDRAFT_816309, partial [Piloderma croceum F 1598]